MKEREALGGYFDLDESIKELKALGVEINTSNFWLDQKKAKEISKKYEALKQEIDTWTFFIKEINEILELAQISLNEKDMKIEIAQKLEILESRFSSLEFNVLFSNKFDKNNAILSIHAGTGGIDAQDWSQMLLRMYLRFCERHNFDVKIIDEVIGNEAGIKSVALEIFGNYVYGWLKSEAGVHRLVRISPFDAEKMRHTSFSLVEVVPEIKEDVNIEIREDDLKIEMMRAGGHGGQSVNTTDSAVRITHLPTGVVVKCQNERSQVQNKITAMKVLKSRLMMIYQEQAEKNLQKIKGEYHRAQWGNQIRSYVLQPYRLVKDHRSEFETTNIEAILNGEIDKVIESFLRLSTSL